MSHLNLFFLRFSPFCVCLFVGLSNYSFVVLWWWTLFLWDLILSMLNTKITVPVYQSSWHGISCSEAYLDIILANFWQCVLVLVTPIVYVTVLTNLDESSVNYLCSENCWCTESLFLPFLCTCFYIQQTSSWGFLSSFFFITMVFISCNLLNYIMVNCHQFCVYIVSNVII